MSLNCSLLPGFIGVKKTMEKKMRFPTDLLQRLIAVAASAALLCGFALLLLFAETTDTSTVNAPVK